MVIQVKNAGGSFLGFGAGRRSFQNGRREAVACQPKLFDPSRFLPGVRPCISMSQPPFDCVSKDCPAQLLVPWILFKHDLVHGMFHHLINRKACSTGKVKEVEVLVQQPWSIGGKEDESDCIGGFGQTFPQGYQKFVMLGMIEKNVGEDQEMESVSAGAEFVF